MKVIKSIHDMDVSNFKMFVTFVLLITAILGYVAVNKYMGANPAATEKTIIEKTGDDTLTNKDALKIGKEKYYLAVATLTNTSTAIDKIYNLVKFSDTAVTDDSIIEKLNSFKGKTYAKDANASLVSNYDEAISNNFTSDFINNNILVPNGYIGQVGDDYYIVKDKKDNFLFKDVKLSLVSKNDLNIVYTAVVISYSSSCTSAGSLLPSITCTDTKKSDSATFTLVKEDSNWKVSEFNLVS